MASELGGSTLGGPVGLPPPSRAFRAQHAFNLRLLTPALVLLGVITIAPMFFLVATSFTPMNLTRPGSAWDYSNPLQNYAWMMQDERFINSLWVQLKLSFWSVTLQMIVGVLFALMLNSKARMAMAMRTVFLVPMVLPPIIVAIIWKVLYTPDISPLWWLVKQLGWDMGSPITSASWALTAIIVADCWQWFPFVLLMVLAGLQGIPEEHLDAAKIDGASRLQSTLYIVLPHLRSVLLVAGLFRLIDSVKTFPLVYLLTSGGPGSVTEITNFYSFIQAFNFSFIGYSSAITVCLMAITGMLSWMILRRVGWRGNVDA
ncbi:MAG: sugar ABC transporter permease [Tagaea sp.]|nr:sugar ABC transporter permease [Tagaea sp.]